MQHCIYCGKELKLKLKCDCGGGIAYGGTVLPCGLKLGAVWIHVTDEEGRNIDRYPVTCSTKEGTATNVDGVTSYDPLASGPYTITLGAVPERLKKTYLLPETTTCEVTVSNGENLYVPFQLLWAPGTLEVTVVDAETGEAILNTPFPTAVSGVGKKPTDDKGILLLPLPPQVISSIAVDLEGCEFAHLYIPGDAGKATVVSGDVAKVTLPVTLRKVFRLQIFDMHKPRGKQKYTLAVLGAEKEKEGETEDDGSLMEYVDPKATGGTLTIGADKQVIVLRFGKLEAVEEVLGIQKRLQHLGYDSGKPCSEPTEGIAAALREFQRDHKLEQTGKITEETRGAMKKVHDEKFTYPEVK